MTSINFVPQGIMATKNAEKVQAAFKDVANQAVTKYGSNGVLDQTGFNNLVTKEFGVDATLDVKNLFQGLGGNDGLTADELATWFVIADDGDTFDGITSTETLGNLAIKANETGAKEFGKLVTGFATKFDLTPPSVLPTDVPPPPTAAAAPPPATEAPVATAPATSAPAAEAPVATADPAATEEQQDKSLIPEGVMNLLGGLLNMLPLPDFVKGMIPAVQQIAKEGRLDGAAIVDLATTFVTNTGLIKDPSVKKTMIDVLGYLNGNDGLLAETLEWLGRTGKYAPKKKQTPETEEAAPTPPAPTPAASTRAATTPPELTPPVAPTES